MDPTQDIQKIQGMYGQMAGMGRPQGQIDPNANLPQHMPSSMQAPPNFPSPNPEVSGSSDNGHKKALLQKLMTNLLSKPGRSMHEIINGVKAAIGAYKNYSKEWDNLGGAVAGAAVGAAVPGAAMGARGIQNILQQVKQKKTPDGSGGPGDRPMGNPNGMPTQAQGTPALGQRPSMPTQAQGVPQRPEMPSMPAQAQVTPPSPQPVRPPQMPSAMPSQAQGVRPTALPSQAQGNPSLPPQSFGNPQPTSMPPAPPVVPQQMGNVPPGMPPMGAMPPIPEIAGQPQTSTFNRPAPVNHLGIFGY